MHQTAHRMGLDGLGDKEKVCGLEVFVGEIKHHKIYFCSNY